MPSKKRELVFATNNPHKLSEVQHLLGEKYRLLSLSDIGFSEEIPEDYNTLELNASQKAWHIYNLFQLDCFADDTGLEVDALDGKPGVYSARYAGEEKNPAANIKKLLKELIEVTNRKARFRTVVSLILDGKEYMFEGIVDGRIIEEEKGVKGFGYDPVFLPDESNLTFAEMDLASKSLISHRARAIGALVSFLKEIK